MPGFVTTPRARGTKRWLNYDELFVHIRQVLAATLFLGEGYRTDLTGTWTTQEDNVSVMLTVDHHTAEILGIHAAKRASRWEAGGGPPAVRRCFGAIRQNIASDLELRHDHGSQYMSFHFQQEIEFLGIRIQPRVRARARGTLKEQLLWARTFDTVEHCGMHSWTGPNCTTSDG